MVRSAIHGRGGRLASCVVLVLGLVLQAASAQGQEVIEDQARTDAFVQRLEAEHISSTISIAPQVAAEPVLGPQIIADSLEVIGNLDTLAREDMREGPEYFRPYSVSDAWAVTFISDTHLSAVGTLWMYTGGAHGNSGFSSVIWDRTARADTPLAGIFEDGESAGAPVWDVLSEHLYEAWEAEWLRRLAGADDSVMDGWREGSRATLTVTPESDPVVTLLASDDGETVTGLTFHYAPYELGPYAIGTFSFDVPQEVFADYLAEDARSLFASPAADGE